MWQLFPGRITQVAALYASGGAGGGATAGPTPTYRHHNFNAVAGATTNDVAYPTGLAANDILLLCVVYEPTGGTGVSLNTPSDFALIGTEETAGSARMALLWKRATGSESGNLTVTLAGTMAGGRIFYVSLAAYSGCLATGNPVETSTQTNGNTTSAPVTMATLTTSGANRRCVCYFGGTTGGGGSPNRSAGPASGWNARGTNTSTTGFDGMIRFDDAEQASAGSPTDDTYGSSANFQVAIIAAALKPNPAG